MAEWYEGSNLNRVAQEFARAFQGTSGGGGSSSGAGGNNRQELNNTIDDEITVREDNIEAINENSEALENMRKKARGYLNNLGDNIESLANRLINFKGFPELARDVKSGLQTAAESGTFLARQLTSVRIGITAENLNQFESAARQATLAMKGTGNMLNQIEGSAAEMYRRFGDAAKATEFTTKTLERFVHSGLTPSMETFNATTEGAGRFGQSMQKSMDQLMAMGVNADEFARISEEASKDELLRNRLRGAASKQERLLIMQSYYARLSEFKALGMSTEQALKAASSLEKIGGKGPLDRFKQAAKAQAALTAMGVEGADVVARYIRAGDRAKGTQLESDARRIMGEASDILSESRGSGSSLSNEMVIDRLAQMSGMQDILKGGEMSTKLDKQADLSQDQVDKLETLTVNTNPSEWEAMLTKVVRGRDILDNFINQTAIGKLTITGLNILGGTLGLIWDFLSKGGLLKVLGAAAAAFGGAGSMMDRLGGRRRRPPRPPRPPGAPGRLAAARNMLNNPLGKLGAAGAAAYGIYQAGQAITTGRSDVHDALVSTEIGQAISEKIGKGMTHFLSWFGNQTAIETLEREKRSKEAENIRQQEEEQLKAKQQRDKLISDRIAALPEEQLKAVEKAQEQGMTPEQALQTVTGTVVPATQKVNETVAQATAQLTSAQKEIHEAAKAQMQLMQSFNPADMATAFGQQVVGVMGGSGELQRSSNETLRKILENLNEQLEIKKEEIEQEELEASFQDTAQETGVGSSTN